MPTISCTFAQWLFKLSYNRKRNVQAQLQQPDLRRAAAGCTKVGRKAMLSGKPAFEVANTQICKHIYMYKDKRTSTHIYIYIYIYAYVYVYMYICMYAYMKCIHMYSYIYICIQIYTYICRHNNLYMCVYAYICVFVFCL